MAVELLRMLLNTFWTHDPEATAFRAEVSDWLLAMPITGHIVVEVGLHILEGESLGHLHGGWKLNISKKVQMRFSDALLSVLRMAERTFPCRSVTARKLDCYW